MLLRGLPASEGMQRKDQIPHGRTHFFFGALAHTEEAIRPKDDKTMKLIGRKRNGVGTVPFFLRRKHRVDTMLVRGMLKTKVFFGLKMFALNFSKLWLHERGLKKCRPLQAETV